MRAAVLLLLIANLALFAYARLDRAAQSEAGRLREQVEPERIKLLSPQQVAALGRTKIVCAEWGPFAEADRLRAQAEIESLAPARLVSQRGVSSDTAYWVNLGAMPTRAAADRRAGELRAQSISDLSVVDYPRGAFTVSLGVFRTEAAANARAETLAARGVTGAQVEPRGQAGAQSTIVVRDAPEALVARMKELQPQFAGADLRVGACPPAS
jgi:SPOR domain